MRVAIDAMLLGGAHSGVEVSIEGLCEGLTAVCEDDRFLIAHRPGYAPGDVDGPLDYYLAPRWSAGKAGRILWERLCLPGVAREWGAEVLHGPGYLLPSGWKGPSVVTIYDILAITHPEWCSRANALHYRLALPRTVRQAHAILVPAEAVREELIRHLGADPRRVHVAHLGIPEAMRPPDPQATNRVRDRHRLAHPYILWVGNIEPKKNVAGLVRAFERVAGGLPHRLILAGRAAWKSEPILRAIETSPVCDRITRLGYVPAEDLPALYAGADLLVHWSLYEGAGLTPIEAMACGTPAIVSDAGALPELAGQVAPVVPLGDPAQLADAMTSLLADRDRLAQLREAGMEWARQFTWARHARQALGIYREAIKLAAETAT
ncbi:MAG: glycosyltransferase family 4 protein [Armatimonadetes bacterium]|nr:glycosyltransferase family 4 protein [Armatimonadota bacterium]